MDRWYTGIGGPVVYWYPWTGGIPVSVDRWYTGIGGPVVYWYWWTGGISVLVDRWYTGIGGPVVYRYREISITAEFRSAEFHAAQYLSFVPVHMSWLIHSTEEHAQ